MNVLKAIVFIVVIYALISIPFKCADYSKRPTDVGYMVDSIQASMCPLQEADIQLTEYVPQPISYLIVHCTAVPPYVHWEPQQLLDFFENERGWSKPGYHAYVERDGTITWLININRDDYIDYSELAYGARGYNSISIHVAYEGGVDSDWNPKDTRTREQKAALAAFIETMKGLYPGIKVMGHRNVSSKACPSFDASSEFLELLGKKRTYLLHGQ